jgi:hypothetical protein
MKILFLHGWMSKPGGLKPSFLAQQCHEVINPALDDHDFEKSVSIAQAAFDRHKPNDASSGISRWRIKHQNGRHSSTYSPWSKSKCGDG